MKEDKLKQYIDGNREEFDSEMPPPMIWMNIEKDLDAIHETTAKVVLMPKRNWMQMAQVAAMFVVVMGVGLLIGLQLSQGRSKTLNPNLQELAEVEKYYNSQIDGMWTTVKASNIEDTKLVESDLTALDEVYQELRQELLKGNGANSEVIVDAMIQNYTNKVKVLETVLKRLKENSQNQQINIEDDKVEM